MGFKFNPFTGKLDKVDGGSSGSGATTFTALEDTPSSITANQFVKGNAAGTAAATWLGSKAAGGGRVFLPTLIGVLGGPGGMVGAYGAATDQMGLGNRIKSMFN